MIFKDMGEVYEINMTHVVNIGKRDPITNFRRYLDTLAKEFEQELTRTMFPQLNIPPTTSHIVVPE